MSVAPPVPRPVTRKRALAVVALACVLALAGCGGLLGGSQLPSGDEAADRYLSLEGYRASVAIEQTGEPDARLRLFLDPDGRNSRSEVLAPPHEAGNVVVYNGTTIVRYNATDNEYVRISTGTEQFAQAADRIRQAIENARSEGTTDAPAVGGAPLPAVPTGVSGSGATDTEFEVSYEGTTTVVGREAHVITYRPVENSSSGLVNQTVWVDAEHFVTLQSRQVARFDGTLTEYHFRLSNVTFDPAFESGLFAFDPPPGATLNASQSYTSRSYGNLSALARASALTVPDPDVPDRYALDLATRIVGGSFRAVQIQYRAGTSQLIVTKTTERSYTDLSTGETVDVGPTTGRYRTAGSRAVVAWSCDGTIHTVTGSLRKSALLDVARSVGCS